MDDPGSIETVPRLLGFVEDERLRELHRQVVIAIQAGQTGPRRQAWRKYVDAAEPQVDFPDDNARTMRARAGLAVAQALINREAGEMVEFMTQLLIAEAAAAAGGWSDVMPLLTAEFAWFTPSTDYVQAQANFAAATAQYESSRRLYDLAIGLYAAEEAASNPDDLGIRGALNLRLAECYQAILLLEEDGLVELVEGDTAQLRQLLFDSLRTAAAYLEDGPAQAKVYGMMDDLEGNEWWQALAE